jgi:HEAT repeat protein
MQRLLRNSILVSAGLATCALSLLSVYLYLENSRLSERNAQETGAVSDHHSSGPTDTVVTSRPSTLPNLPKSNRLSLSELWAEFKEASHTIDAVRTLRRIGAQKDTMAIGPLAELLDDQRQRIRLAAAEALGQIGGKVVQDTLEDALVSKEYRRVAAAAYGLSVMGNVSATDVLIRELENHANKIAHSTIINALADIDTADARDALATALYDGPDNLRMSAANALGRMQGGLRIIKAAITADNLIKVRTAAIHALAKDEDPTVDDMLTDLLTDRNGDIRQAAIRALGGRKNEKSYNALKRIVMNSSNAELNYAITAIAKHDNPKTVRFLLGAIGKVEKWRRSSIVYGLSAMSTEAAIEALVSLLKYPDVYVQSSVAYALSRNHPEALLQLDPLTVSKSIRRYVLKALWTVRREESLPTFQRALSSPNPQLVSDAVQAMGGLSGVPADERRTLLDRVTSGALSPSFLQNYNGRELDVAKALIGALKNGESQEPLRLER